MAQPHRDGAGAPPRPPGSPYAVLKLLVPLWLVLLGVAAVTGAVLGSRATSGGIEGTHAAVALERYGRPQAFWLVDGPGTPGGDDAVRAEQWYYPEKGVVLTFYDGRLAAEQETTFSQELGRSTVSPTTLHRGLERSDVEAALSEAGVRLRGVRSPYSGLRTYTYARNRLLVGYLDGRFFTAQVY